MTTSDQSIPYIAIVGDAGVGKSTLVNVLMGSEAAKTSWDAVPCTTETKKYTMCREGSECCHILDTRGLNEASEGVFARLRRFLRILPPAEREVRKVLRGKDPRFPSINLVLLCIDANKFKAGKYQEIYRKIFIDFCEGKLTMAVVVMRVNEEHSEWKRRCESNAEGIVKDLLVARLIEGVPNFEPEELNDSCVRDCRDRILKLISSTCPKRPAA